MQGWYDHSADQATCNWLLGLWEAADSSRLEGIHVDDTDLYLAERGIVDTPEPGVPAVLRCRDAMEAGREQMTERGYSTSTAIAIASTLHGYTAHLRAGYGTYIGDPATGEAIYTPPQGRDVIAEHLALWERFMNERARRDPLFVMALGHYQFEAIHPFDDGNGRTGRILNNLYLSMMGAHHLPILPMSWQLATHQAEYYRRLRHVTENGDWSGWVTYMTTMTGYAAMKTTGILREFARERASTTTFLQEQHPRWPVDDIVNLIMSTLLLRPDDFVDAGLASPSTARRWVKQLQEHKILRRRTVGKTTYFAVYPLMRNIWRHRFYC
ncbi:addiction module protein [Corynebacterium sp. 13CS0277]|uniref:Fic family protein n=1 Tax=Corynebacterium sp. 13CS0277 TaxID=2071994 RepID=UPI000D03831C|nr:Fic family protein [Corynebacterium sp. 13CS0277]PRQ10953.1 addiction module protein [Corynebacterium sp. 13CS0277]